MGNYQFVTALFGEKHLGMLLVNLYAIQKNVPNAKVSVFWQEIGEEKKADFKKAFPNVDFQETNFDLSSTKIKRISSKILLWNHAANILSGENLFFLDVDMMVLKDVGEFFNQDFDILFTDKKDEIFPLNTGVMLTKGEKRKEFFREWLKKTLEILESKQLLRQATSKKYPFGGADQMSFYNLVGYKKGVTNYNVSDMKFVSVPCSVLNETRSRPISSDVHIIHYKGGWQMMLLSGKGFTKDRTRKNSWQMYMLFLSTYLEALKYLSDKSGRIYKDLGIVIPFYLDKKTLKENKFLYSIFSIIKYFESLIDSIKFRLRIE